jgi:transcriptional regulator with XRE-family HTH domain
MFDATIERSPNLVDVHVGSRIRMRRRVLGISQEKLAAALGLTFQQVQKYERGTNRVSASKLYETAKALSAPISYFFEGLADPATDDNDNEVSEQAVHEFLMTAEGLELSTLFPRIRKGSVRRRMLDLVRSLGDDVSE